MLSFRLVGKNLCRTVLYRFYSGPPASITADIIRKPKKVVTVVQKQTTQEEIIPLGSLVSAAFNSINNDDDVPKENDVKSDVQDKLLQTILNAKSVAELLSVSGSIDIKRNHALKIVSILSDWTTLNRIQLSDFENDTRFIKLCRLLGRAASNQKQGNKINLEKTKVFQVEDLNLVLGVAGDDEAAKLISDMSLPQMIKIMSSLAQRKRRSTPILRSLAYNISGNSDQLNLKQCADLLFAMAALNFFDTVLVARIGIDIQTGLATNSDRPAAVGSIITSLGLMKFKDADLLDMLTAWTIKHSEICRPVDILSLLMTLAICNSPTNHTNDLQTKLISTIQQTNFSKAMDWLNFVWSLTVLDFAKKEHVESVLQSEFIERLVMEQGGNVTPTTKMKLLNINAAAKLLIPEYNGPTISPEGTIFSIPLANSKSKEILVVALKDALTGLFTSEDYVKTHINTQMGFVIDAECVLDKKRNPLPVGKNHKDAIRCALVVLDFHDFCQGSHNQPNGIAALSIRLLEKSGYKVLTFPHFEFNSSDKLLKRVQYLEWKIKDAVNSQA